MMWAALIGEVSAYVIFNGGTSQLYPQWFTDYVEESMYENEFRYMVYDPGTYRYSYHPLEEFRVWPDELTEGYDVFMMNSRGDIMRTTIDIFNKHYLEVAPGIVALKEDCIEYVHYTNDYDIFPEWFVKEVIDGGRMHVSDGLIYNGLDGSNEIFNSGQLIFLRNKWGEIKTVPVEDFNQTHVWWLNWRLEELGLI